MKQILIRILWLLIGLVLGISVYRYSSPITSLESEKEYVDSIQVVIDTLVIEKEHVRWKINKVKEEKVLRVDSVKNLPVPEAVNYLENKIEEYEKSIN